MQWDELSKLLNNNQYKMGNTVDYFSSSVLIPLVAYKGEFRVLFEVRSADIGWQPGDICFPGGRIEPGDTDAKATAIRETCEELGIEATKIQVFGSMNYIVSQIGALVYPYVGFLAETDFTGLNSAEVGRVFSVPLSFLMQAKPVVGRMETATKPVGDFPWHLMPSGYPRDWKERSFYNVYFYQYKEFVIWGLTARILHDFIEICKKLNVMQSLPK